MPSNRPAYGSENGAKGHEGRLVDGAKQWSRGVKVLYGESAEEQERVAEELGVDVDVKEDDYCCARKS